MGDSIFFKAGIFIFFFVIAGGFGIVSMIIKKHKLAKQHIPETKLPFLGVGAIYYKAHAGMEKTLMSPLTKREIRSMLKRDWGIKSKEDAIALINSGTAGTIHSVLFDEQLASYKTSKNFTNNVNMFIQFYGKQGLISQEKLSNCKTTIAWDLERAAMLTRYAYSIDLFTEDEAWRYLSPILDRTKTLFNTWEDYARSFLLGRCMWGGNKMDSTLLRSISLLSLSPKSGNSIWGKYPLRA